MFDKNDLLIYLVSNNLAESTKQKANDRQTDRQVYGKDTNTYRVALILFKIFFNWWKT